MAQFRSLDTRIKDLMKEGSLVALYFSTGITFLHEKIESMSDEEISEMFSGLLHPERVRKNIKYLFDELNK